MSNITNQQSKIMSQQIEIWNDTHSEPGESCWCVSLCWESGDEINCLSTHDDRDEAIAAGKKAAHRRELPLIERDENGETTEIE